MTDHLAPADVGAARAEAALEGVTPGPWHAEASDDPYDNPVMGPSTWLAACPDCGVRGGFDAADARFIAASRELVPELLAEVKRLSKLTEAMAGQLDLWMRGHPMTGARQSDVAALITYVRERAQ